jgi:phosphate-selective porin OprO/OprP
MTVACVTLQIAAVVPARAGEGQDAQQQQSEENRQSDVKPPVFVMDDHPSMRFGKVFRVDFTTKLDGTLREYENIDLEGDAFALGHRRVGVEGRFLNFFGFEVEREIGDDEQPWRDVFAELRQWRALRVRAGRFKLPFGQERLTPITQLDFVYRSLATDALTPARDTGVEASGRLFGRALTYRAGVFQHDGDVSRRGTDAPGDQTYASRITVTPLAWAGPEAFDNFEVGVAMTLGDVPEGLNGLGARTVGGYEALAPLYVAGTRVRLGADASWKQGPVSIRGEFLQARDQRLGQGLGGEDLADVTARGGYVSGTWFIVGDLKSNGTAPRSALFSGGAGAIQLAARIEWLGFISEQSVGQPFRNPRAANILPNDIRSWTVGANWFPVRFVKLQFNLIREHVEDPERRPDPARAWTWSRVFRIQFAL